MRDDAVPQKIVRAFYLYVVDLFLAQELELHYLFPSRYMPVNNRDFLPYAKFGGGYPLSLLDKFMSVVYTSFHQRRLWANRRFCRKV